MEIHYSLKDKRRGITLPPVNEKLAEETGIHIGDGSMSYQNKGYRLVLRAIFSNMLRTYSLFACSLKSYINIDSNIKKSAKAL